MTDDYAGGLLNAVDAIVAFWSQRLTETLDRAEAPDDRFWQRLSQDLVVADQLVQRVRTA